MVSCCLCGSAVPNLAAHLTRVHPGVTLEAYADSFPGPVADPEYLSSFPAPRAAAPIVKILGIPCRVNHGVDAAVVEKTAPHYTLPTEKDPIAYKAHRRLFDALEQGDSVWVHGPPGSGKDEALRAYSTMTRCPTLVLTVVQGQDLSAWKFARSFTQDGTYWEEGVLLKAVRDGYRAADGRVIPYLIVLSDFDRCTASQAEELRGVLDSTEGKIIGPDGAVHRVLKGTRFAATANSMGQGDPSGRMVSARMIDGSIVDRFNYGVRFAPIGESTEEEIILKAHPILKKDGHARTIARIGSAVRAAAEKGDADFDWTVRSSLSLAKATARAIELGETNPVKYAFENIKDKAPNADVALCLDNAAASHIPRK